MIDWLIDIWKNAESRYKADVDELKTTIDMLRQQLPQNSPSVDNIK